MMKEFCNKFEKFMKESDDFGGFYMKGNCDMSVSDLLFCFKKYGETGSTDAMKEYHDLSFAGNIIQQEYLLNEVCYIYTIELVDYYKKLLINNTNWNVSYFYSSEQIDKLVRYLDQIKDRINYKKSKKYIRVQASIFTGNKKNRNAIFNRDGKVCKNCGTTKDLTLDHIIPVSKGGENTLDNLQVLCRSCNSKKNNKIEK